MTSGGVGWASVGTVPELKAEGGMGDRNPGLHVRGLLGWQERRRKGVRGGDPREASAKGCDGEEGPRGEGRAGRGGRKAAGCPGALDPRAGAVVPKVRVPSGSAGSRAIPVGRSNTGADSVIKRE